jgi:hypothetical protein
MNPEIFILIYGITGFTLGFVGLYFLFKPWADDQDRRRLELIERGKKIEARRKKLNSK